MASWNGCTYVGRLNRTGLPGDGKIARQCQPSTRSGGSINSYRTSGALVPILGCGRAIAFSVSRVLNVYRCPTIACRSRRGNESVDGSAGVDGVLRRVRKRHCVRHLIRKRNRDWSRTRHEVRDGLEGRFQHRKGPCNGRSDDVHDSVPGSVRDTGERNCNSGYGAGRYYLPHDRDGSNGGINKF